MLKQKPQQQQAITGPMDKRDERERDRRDKNETPNTTTEQLAKN